MNILARTYEQFKYENKGKELHAHLRTMIRFHFDTEYLNTFSEDSLKYILSAIGNYLMFFATRDQAKSYVDSL